METHMSTYLIVLAALVVIALVARAIARPALTHEEQEAEALRLELVDAEHTHRADVYGAE